mmetsp:Transcript_12329/g.37603  ORF Transcript_12329/g.37603 Transcript_12329/m.37603 type:complete len:206 (+) Transcript_12329:161-778(+)
MRSAGVGPRDACFLTAWGPPTCRLRGTDRWRCSAQGPEHKRTINVCTGTSCTDQGSKSTLEALKALTTGSEGRVCVQDCGCLNMCGEGPNVVDSRTRSVHKAVRDVRSMLHLLEGIEVPEDLVQALQYKEEGNRLLTGKRAREAKEAYRQALEHVPHGPGEEIQRVSLHHLLYPPPSPMISVPTGALRRPRGGKELPLSSCRTLS